MEGNTCDVPVKKNKGKLIALFAGIGVVIVTVAVILISLFVGESKNYESLIKADIRNYNNRTLGFDAYTDSFWDEAKGEAFTKIYKIRASEYADGTSIDDIAEEKYIRYYESLTSTYGNQWEITYKIVDKEQLNADEINECNENWHEKAKEYTKEAAKTTASYMSEDEGSISVIADALYDFGKRYEKDVTEAVRLDIRFTIAGSSDSCSYTVENVLFVKVDGTWLCDDTYFVLDYFL